MKYCNEINVENSSAQSFDLTDHVVATATVEDEERKVWHTSVMVLNRANGKVHTTTATQREDDSYFHHILAPLYRICCNKVGVEPRVRE